MYKPQVQLGLCSTLVNSLEYDQTSLRELTTVAMVKEEAVGPIWGGVLW